VGELHGPSDFKENQCEFSVGIVCDLRTVVEPRASQHNVSLNQYNIKHRNCGAVQNGFMKL